MADVMICLIQRQAVDLDMELCASSQTIPFYYLTVLTSNDSLTRQKCLDTSSSSGDDGSKQNTFQQSQDHSQQLQSQNLFEHRFQEEEKDIQDTLQIFQANYDWWPKCAQKKGYPINNLLWPFRKHHLQFVEEHLKEDALKKDPFIRKFKVKQPLTMKDSQKLYCNPEYDEVFKTMFKSKFLYQKLQQTRCRPTNKIIFKQKLYVFEQDFHKEKIRQNKLSRTQIMYDNI